MKRGALNRSLMGISLLALALSLLGPVNAGAEFELGYVCQTNCLYCYDNAVGSCFLCDETSHVMDQYICEVNTHACTTGYTRDIDDKVCRKSRYKFDSPCPLGTYNTRNGQFDPDACIDCPPGYYCPMVAEDENSYVKCDAGLYCKGKSSMGTGPDDALTFECEKGFYCPEGSGDHMPCPAGRYCSKASLAVDEGKCKAGYYCQGESTTDRPTNLATEKGAICPVGTYCELGSSAPTKCPKGTYNPMLGATKPEDCLDCTAGFACPNEETELPTVDCTGGYFCPKGTESATPAAYECQPGYYCPAAVDLLGVGKGGSAYPRKCEFGKVQTDPGKETCDVCATGKYCENNVINDCKKGHWCPGSNVVNPCPIGKYGDVLGQSTEGDACKDCLAGWVCDQPGISTLNVMCDGGYYCETGATTKAPSGKKCGKGTYCPPGSAVEVTCTKGQFCAEEGLSNPSGPCQAGHFCIAGATTSTKAICGAGYYCPEGSFEEQDCPIGTYNPNAGAESVNDCVHCEQGQYCETVHLSAPTEKCSAGFYCPVKQSVIEHEAYTCPKGHMCPEGSPAPKPCPFGEFQISTGQPTCNPCPEGYFCDYTDSSRMQLCPAGHYCEENTYAPYTNPCPAGNYRSDSGGKALGDCDPCGGGYYCPLEGMQSYFDPCPAGYKCPPGVTVPTEANKCTVGHFCPEATETPQGCYEGTYMDSFYTTDATECQKCPPGRYCAEVGKTLAELVALGGEKYGECLAGYICYLGSYSQSPIGGGMGEGCAKGHYCDTGSFVQKPCERGYYQNLKYQGSCKNCKKGKFCDLYEMDTPASCTPGFYCPESSKIPTPCPPGKYSTVADLFDPADCPDCTAGKYCEKPATESADMLNCSAGFVCGKGSDSMMPSAEKADGITNFRCPTASYCVEGSAAELPCPGGTYQNSVGGGATCEACPPGKYCGAGVADAVACPAGSVCVEGSTTNSAKCKPNHMCPVGTANDFPCPDGKVSGGGNSECSLCPQGHHCRQDPVGDTLQDLLCPAHHFCVAGSTYSGEICPAGTMTTGSDSGKSDAAGCTNCEPGKYCVDGKADGLTLDDCVAGHYCAGGKNAVPDPTKTGDDNRGVDDLCPKGKYCDAGTTQPTTCPTSKFRAAYGGRQVSDCTECELGYYCETGNPVPFECPPGHFCPTSSSEPTECLKNTYNTLTLKGYSYECASCPAGYLCDDTKIGNINYTDPNTDESTAKTGEPKPLDDFPCTESHYCYERARVAIHCPEGKYLNATSKGTSEDQCFDCPYGYYCVLLQTKPVICDKGYECLGGAIQPRKCEGGYYCDHDEDGLWFRKPCPYKFYCPLKTITPIECPEDLFCLEQASYPQRCPFGMFRVETIPSFADDLYDVCLWCAQGEYSGTEKCEPCEAGYICLGETIARYPLVKEEDNGYECPVGHYCPSQIAAPIECPQGTYRAQKLGKKESDCLPCPTNTYNDLMGQKQCTLCGSSAVSLPGSTTCECIGKYREFNKGDASCRCIPMFEYTAEGVTSRTEDSSDDCTPIAYDICADGEGYNYEGNCVSESDCSAQCNGGDGSVKEGICTCSATEGSADSYCNSGCRSGSYAVKYVDGKLVTVDANGNTVATIASSNVYNGDKATGSTYKGGFFLDADTGMIHCSYNAGGSSRRSLSAGRLLATSTDIPTPLVCLEIGQGMTWAVTNLSYPVYLKDSLLNTVKGFDYGSFTLLEEKLTKTGLTIDTFLFSFQEEGQYLFGDSSDLNKQIMIKVTNLECDEAFIQPLSNDNLKALGITPRDDIIHQRELWYFMLALALFLLIFLIVILLIIFVCPKVLEWIKARGARDSKRDMSKFAELDEEEQYREMKEMLAQGEAQGGVDTMFFTFLRDKLREMDIKMKLQIENSNMKSMQRLRELILRVIALKDMFGVHYKALVLKNGMTIDEFLAAYEDQLQTGDKDFGFLYGDTTTDSSGGSKAESDKAMPILELDDAEGSSHLSIEEEEKPQIGQVLDGFDEADHNDREKFMIEKNGAENEQKLDAEFKAKREEMRRLLEAQGVDPEEIARQLHLFTEKMQALKNSLDEDNQLQKDQLLARLQARQAKKKAGVVKASEVSTKAEETDTKFKAELDIIKEEEKEELDNVEHELIKLKKDGLEMLKGQEKKKMEDIRADLKRQLQNTKDPKEIERLLKRHEEEAKRIKDYLEIEREKQIHNLEAKLKAAKMQRKRKVLDKYGQLKGEVEDKKKKEMDKLEKERIIVEGEHELEDYFGKGKNIFTEIEETQNRKDLELSIQKEMEIEMLKTGNQNELDAIEKHYNMYEQETNENLRKGVLGYDRDADSAQEKLKKQFMKENKNAPTSKEKADLMQEYELMKEQTANKLNEGRRTQESTLKMKLADRKRKKEIKLLREDKDLEDCKLKKELEFKEKSAENRRILTIDAIFKMIEKEITKGNITDNELPLFMQHLLKQKSDEELRELANKQFYELSNAILNLYATLNKEKLIEKGQIEEDYERKYRDLDSKGLAGNKYQKEWMRLKRNEEDAKQRLNQKYENLEQEKENILRSNLTEKHCDEKLVQAENEEEDKKALFEKLKRRFHGRSNMIEDIANHLIKQNANDMTDKIKDIKNKKAEDLEDLKKKLFQDNVLEMEEIEKKAQKELQREEARLEDKFKHNKENVMNERKKNFSSQLERLNDLSGEHKAHLIKQYNLELEDLEKTMDEERENQLTKMKEKLLNKKIQQERIKAKAIKQARMRKSILKSTSVIMPLVDGPEEEDEGEEKKREMEALERQTRVKEQAEMHYRPLLAAWRERMEEELGPRVGGGGHQMDLGGGDLMSDDSIGIFGDRKDSIDIIGEEKKDEGGYVKMDELYEKVFSCEELAENVNDYEMPQIGKTFDKLVDFMDNVEKGQKKFGMATMGQSASAQYGA